MGKAPVAVVRLTRPTVTMERGSRAVRRYILMGECLLVMQLILSYRPWPWYLTSLSQHRYAEMLEEQQKWLVYALQKLYRHTTQGEGWPGGPLRCEDNGHPLTHDILCQLGALGRSERHVLEDKVDNTQSTEHRTSPESIDTTSETTQTMRFPSITSEDIAGQDSLAPPIATYLPQQSPCFKTESSMPQTPAGLFAPRISMEDGANLIPWQTSQHWPNDPFDFNSMDFISGFDYMTTSFDEAIAPSVPDIYGL